MSNSIINILGKLLTDKASTAQTSQTQDGSSTSLLGSIFDNLFQGKTTSSTASSKDDSEIINTLYSVAKELVEGGTSASSQTNSSGTTTTASATKTGTSTSSQVSALRDSYSKLQSEEGIVSKAAGWVKNLFGAKSSPNYVESQISALETKISSGQSVSQSEIDSVNDLIANYSNRSEDGSNTVAAATGLGVGASCGAAIGTALFPGVGTVIGGLLGGFIGGFAAGSATKVALEQLDNVTDTTEGNSFNLEDMVEDGVEGGLIGGSTGALGGVMKVTGTTGKMTASSINGTINVLNNVVTLYTPEEEESQTSESERKSAANTLGSFAKNLLAILLKSAK